MTTESTATGPGGRIVVTVQGVDRVGIVAEVTRVLAACRANLTDISQSILHGDLFWMVVVADMAPDGVPFETLRHDLDTAGQTLGVQIRVQREEIFRAMHRV